MSKSFATFFQPRNLNTSFIENGIIYQWLINRTQFSESQDGDYRLEVETSKVFKFSKDSNTFELITDIPPDVVLLLKRPFVTNSESLLFLRKETEIPLFNPTFNLQTIDEVNDKLLYNIPINILLNAYRIECSREFIVDIDGTHIITRFDKKIELYCSVYERAVEFDLYNNTQCINDLNRSSVECAFLESIINNEDTTTINNAALVRSIADLTNYFYHSSAILIKNVTPTIDYIFYNQKTSDVPYLDILVVNNCSSLLINKFRSNELCVNFVKVVNEINKHLLK